MEARIPRSVVEEINTSDEGSQATNGSHDSQEDPKFKENTTNESIIHHTQDRSGVTKMSEESSTNNQYLGSKREGDGNAAFTTDNDSPNSTGRSNKNPFYGPVDPEYARILGSITFGNTHTRGGSTEAALSHSSDTSTWPRGCYGSESDEEYTVKYFVVTISTSSRSDQGLANLLNQLDLFDLLNSSVMCAKS